MTNLRNCAPAAVAVLIALAGAAYFPVRAQQSPAPELTGTVGYDVTSEGGRVENLAVTIGDGGTGPYKAILAGDSSLPTHAIYRPKDLKPFGGKRPLPIVAFANGGCRNSSGEFRNFLSEIASHGFLVVAIGPAGNAVVMGSEERLATTRASQLMDGVDWATKENSRQGSEYYQKVDTSKVAVMGQSCGGGQALEVSTDPRVTTSVILNSSAVIGAGGRGATPPPSERDTPTPAAANAAPGTYGTPGSPPLGMFAALDAMAKRYTPYGPSMVASGAPPLTLPDRSETLTKLHGPVAYVNGGPSDIAYAGAQADFAAIDVVPVFFASQDVGHYPGTYRKPHGGAFAEAVTAWLQWQLKGDKTAAKMFVGNSCGLCTNASWKVRKKKID